MVTSSKQSFPHIQAIVASAIAGVQKNFSSVTQITLGGVVYTTAALLAILEAYAPLVSALTAAHNQLHAAVLAERAQRRQVLSLLKALAGYVINLYGSDPNKVGDFGFSLKKVGVESAATRAAAVAKMKATRAAKKTALAAVGSPAATAPTAPVAPAPQPAAGGTTSKS